MFDFSAGTEFEMLTSAANGMTAQRTVLDLAARNVAAAQAATPGHPYARLVAQFSDAADATESALSDAGDAADEHAEGGISAIRTEPGSGDALTEMIAVLDAQRAYEQHATVFDIGKRLAERTIDLGRS